MSTKKIFKSSISMLLAIMMLASLLAMSFFTLIGCSSEEDTLSDNSTYSNGGMAVEHGDYMYFINGNAGYPNAEIDQEINEFGEEEKGGLYRVKKHDYIINYADTTARAEYLDDYAEHEGIDFLSTEQDWFDLRNYYIDDTHVVNDDGLEIPEFNITDDTTEYHIADHTDYSTGESTTNIEPIVKKIIGTGDYAGGIYIFDTKIYFASASDSLDETGGYQYDKVDFYMCDLDGGNLSLIYTSQGRLISSETGPSVTSIPYTFTKQNGVVNLTTYEQWYADEDDEKEGNITGYIINTEIINGKAYAYNIVAEDVTDVYFPDNRTYTPGAMTNSVEDFVYFTRDADDYDDQTDGNILEMIRPNGDDRDIIINSSKTVSIQGVSGDFLYYRHEIESGTTLEYTNLYTQLVRSSYERTTYSDGTELIKTDSDGNYVVKDTGRTFIDEQAALVSDYNEWRSEYTDIYDVTRYDDARYVAYNEKYIDPDFMTETSNVIVSNFTSTPSGNAYTDIFLMPYRSISGTEVRVIADNGTYSYNHGTDGATQIYNSGFEPYEVSLDGDTVYGYNSSMNFVALSLTSTSTSGNNAYIELTSDYSTIDDSSLIRMDMINIHDNEGNVVNTHIMYNTDYPDENTNYYSVLYKVAGDTSSDSATPIPCGYVLPEDKALIVCYDPQCFDPTHDHSGRDGYDITTNPDDEDESEGSADE